MASEVFERHSWSGYVTRSCPQCERKEVTGFDAAAYRYATAWVDDHLIQHFDHDPVALIETHATSTYGRSD